MMTNLFSMFDPSTNYNMNLNWLSTLFILTLIPLKFWLLPNNYSLIYKKMIITLFNEFKVIVNMKNNNKFNIIFISLFTFIILNNFIGLFPYIFTATSHMTLNLTLTLPLWLSLLLYGWMKKTNHMFTHLVPQSTPYLLIPFMVCIETISNIIRPITLTIRLTANMIAGHLLLMLLSSMGSKLNLMLTPIIIITSSILLVLESAVSIIQSYVFSILMTLYSSEI